MLAMGKGMSNHLINNYQPIECHFLSIHAPLLNIKVLSYYSWMNASKTMSYIGQAHMTKYSNSAQ